MTERTASELAPAARRPGGPRPTRAQELRDALGDLRRIAGIRGGLLVAQDGLVIAAELPAPLAAEPLAALAATLGRELESSVDQLGRSAFRTASFSAEDGTVFVGGSAVGYLILIADATADQVVVSSALRSALTRLEASWAPAE
jgi:predicted regulator of Ras-like GTPase activity (Roadblock/LC7/MglB family)